jgi:hypothetical protein
MDDTLIVRDSMQGIQEISHGQPTVISSEDLKALLYLTIRGQNGLTKPEEKQHSAATTSPLTERAPVLDTEKGVDIKA